MWTWEKLEGRVGVHMTEVHHKILKELAQVLKHTQWRGVDGGGRTIFFTGVSTRKEPMLYKITFTHVM